MSSSRQARGWGRLPHSFYASIRRKTTGSLPASKIELKLGFLIKKFLQVQSWALLRNSRCPVYWGVWCCDSWVPDTEKLRLPYVSWADCWLSVFTPTKVYTGTLPVLLEPGLLHSHLPVWGMKTAELGVSLFQIAKLLIAILQTIIFLAN